LREKSEQQRGHVFRGKKAQIARKIFYEFFGKKKNSTVGCRTVRIRTVLYSWTDLGTEIEALLAQFSRQFPDFLWLFLGHMEQSV
jgi:hypothetical protein